MANMLKDVMTRAADWKNLSAEDYTEILGDIRPPSAGRYDPNRNLEGLQPWSMDDAEERARHIGVEMSEDHWEVVLLLRDYYCDGGDELDALQMLNALAREFTEDGGKRFLYQLFPGGPVTQGARIAGIPLPAGARDTSFGTAH